MMEGWARHGQSWAMLRAGSSWKELEAEGSARHGEGWGLGSSWRELGRLGAGLVMDRAGGAEGWAR